MGAHEKGLCAMKRRNRLIGLLVGSWLAVGFVSVAQADLNDYFTAYQQGDYDSALKELKTLAEQGDVWAQYHRGLMYYQGRGVPQDYKEAEKWYRKAAEQGNANAQWHLGQMYENAIGVPRDNREAAKWYRKVAEQGIAMAQDTLGVMYQIGQGVPQDYVLAHKWFNLAAAQGDEFARKSRDIIANSMTRGEIAEAEKLAREWKPKE